MIGWIKRIPLWIKILSVLFGTLCALICAVFMLLESAFGMVDDQGITSWSPDHHYKATLHRKDGITCDYQHIVLQVPGPHPLGIGIADIVEVDCNGLNGISWRNNRTLVVDYDATIHKDPMFDTAFMHKYTRWRDVRIEYHKSFSKDESVAPTGK